MKKIIFLIMFFYFFSLKANAGLVYPIKQMSKPDCRFQDFSTLSGDCKQDLPILNTKDYSKYKNDYVVYRRIYTVLWGSTYNFGWDVGNGGHSGVDIASAKGTPVLNVYDGKVLKAGFVAGRGNFVRIEHTINGKKIYSNYAHLSKIDVKIGDVLNPGDKVGEVGNTGNSYGNHLHFQIDTSIAGSGPWYRKNCKVKDYNSIINGSACFEELNQNTIDPLLFLETSGAIIKQGGVVDKPKQENISQKGLLSREEILKIEIDNFLKNYNLNFELDDIGGNIILGKTGILNISVNEKFGAKKPFNGSFPGNMTFRYDSKKMSIFPTGILQIDNGARQIQITPKVDGNLSFDIYIGDSFVKKINFGVFSLAKPIIPTSGEMILNQNAIIGENNKSKMYFKNSAGLKILGVGFKGDLEIYSNDNMKFCLKKIIPSKSLEENYNQKCSEEEFKNPIKFNYYDSYKGYFILEYKATKLGDNRFFVRNSSKINVLSKKITGNLPNGFPKTHSYFEEMIFLGQNGIITGVNNGYYLQDRDLTYEDGYYFIKNSINYLKNNCKSNCQKYSIFLQDIEKMPKDRYKYLTRLEFLTLLGKYFDINEYKNTDFINFRDLGSVDQNLAKNILKTSTWKDNFGQTRYFQPNKNISRAEAAYLIYKIIKK